MPVPGSDALKKDSLRGWYSKSIWYCMKNSPRRGREGNLGKNDETPISPATHASDGNGYDIPPFVRAREDPAREFHDLGQFSSSVLLR